MESRSAQRLVMTVHSSKFDLDEYGMISGQSSYTMVSSWVAVIGNHDEFPKPTNVRVDSQQ